MPCIGTRVLGSICLQDVAMYLGTHKSFVGVFQGVKLIEFSFGYMWTSSDGLQPFQPQSNCVISSSTALQVAFFQVFLQLQHIVEVVQKDVP